LVRRQKTRCEHDGGADRGYVRTSSTANSLGPTHCFCGSLGVTAAGISAPAGVAADFWAG
jgi:hypothetical protein